MARILIVEDERDLQQILDYNLRQAGHEVLAALRGKDGLDLARSEHPDLILLDLMLPDMAGTEVCRTLKQDPGLRTIPVVILTARGEEIDRVVGFELGADDYVVKPFSVRELLLRIQAILRRGQGTPAPAGGAGEADPAGLVTFGCLQIDRAAHRVWIEGAEVELTALEFKLLVTLYERRNRVQTRGGLLEEVWGIQPDVNTRTVDTHIKRLREKLGAASAYVETVRGVGYRFADSPAEATG